MVTILAFLVIGGAGAYAAKKLKLKNNSVTTQKIRDGAVQTPDLADAAVSTAKLQNAAVSTAKLQDGSVDGAKVADKSLGAADLSDAVLGDRSIGRQDTAPGTCSPTAVGLVCVDVVLQLPRAGRVFVNADGGALYQTNALVIGACQLTADGAGVAFGVPLAGNGTAANPNDHFSLTGVTDPLPAGSHTFALLCTESGTELSIVDSHISAVSLSAD